MTTFSDDTFNFFAAIRFNNNRAFFHDNHAWYQSSVREPALCLAEALAPAIASLDPNLIVQPNKVVSRINRDIRFSNDKSPYRDYLWLGFHRPGEEKNSTLGAYFDISDEYASFGVGLYAQNRPYWNGVKHALEHDAETFLRHLRRAERSFTAELTCYKKKSAPDGMPEALRPWYLAKTFVLFRRIEDYDLLKSDGLSSYIISKLEDAKPLYRYLLAVTPIDE